MKKIITTDIVAGAAMRFKSGTMNLLQEAIIENDLDLLSAMTTTNGGKASNYVSPYVMSGCNITGTTSFDISIGVLFFGSTLYRTNVISGLT